IYQGSGKPHDGIAELPAPPPWRDFAARRDQTEDGVDPRGKTFRARKNEVDLVNAALYLRRPLFITGPPGSGKSTLAYAMAYELKLGSVLRWPINSRSTLQEGLYHYDALARLWEIKAASEGGVDGSATEDLGRYIKLGPLGTALLPGDKPRVLLIDEIDKADIDLPNDLLHVFEEGEFEIPELVRIQSKTPQVRVMPAGRRSEADRVPIEGGWVRCSTFPLVVITSNSEREMPPALRRRCLSLTIEPPNPKELAEIVDAHFAGIDLSKVDEVIKDFLRRRADGVTILATDQLLNAIFIVTGEHAPEGHEMEQVLDIVLHELNQE
ncbi:MAG: MoxR family ATPase, partial [Acidobacteria bacterium]|nr:MoxR family ATPase [Acidobacteriota bacterium]